MRRLRRVRAVVALSAWLAPWLATAATGLHLALDADHQIARLDPRLPASLRGPAHTHEAPEPAPAVTVEVVPRVRPAQAASLAVVMPVSFDGPRLAEWRGFPGRSWPGPDPPQLATGHSVLRV